MKDSFQVLNDLVDAGVIKTYAIGGAIAASFYVEASETDDIDVFVLFSTNPPLFQELHPIYTYLQERGFRPKDEYVTIFDWDVQFLLTESGSLREEAVETANIFSFDGIAVRVILPQYLVADGLAVGRPKDFARARKFLDENKVEKSSLWSLIERFELQDRWEKLSQI
jgi:hypothetical protein